MRNTHDEPADAALIAVAENAKSLLSDAELLYSNGRWARAASLAVLAVEEVGKYFQQRHRSQDRPFLPRDHSNKQSATGRMLVAEAVYQRLTSVLASQGLELKHPDDMSPNQAAFATTPAGRQFSESIFESPSLRNELAEAIRSASTEPFTAKALAGQLSNIKCLGMYVDLRNDGSVHCEPAHVTEELADQILDYAKSAVRLVDTYSSET